MTRPLRMLAALCCLAASALAPGQAPYVPKGNGDVLQRVTPASDPAIREMAGLRDRVAREPRSAKAADDLARAYVAFGRRVGDAHYMGYAEAVLAPWMTAAPPHILVTQAAILAYRHEFANARALLSDAVARDPRHAQAWLSLASLDMVQGHYAAAAEHCARAGKHGGVALALVCTANVRLYTGEAEQGLALLRRAEGEAPGFKAWVEGLLAEGHERLGRWREAEVHYRNALRHAPHDNFLLVAYADFLLDRGRPGEVLPLLGDHADSDTAFLRLALAHAAMNSPQAARYQWIMAARFAGYERRGDEYFGREHARFLLHLARDPDAALVSALRNWQTQREPWDARIVLEAAHAAGKPHAAAPVLAFLAQSRLQDPRIAALVRP